MSSEGQNAPPTSERGNVTRAAGVVGALTLLSRMSGLARDIVISGVFGAGTGADAFFVAFRIPNLMRRLVAEGAAATAFVPVFTDRLVAEGRAGLARASAAVGGVFSLVLLAICVVGVLAARPLVELFAPGFVATAGKADLTISLTRWTFPYLFFAGGAAWAMGTLHTVRTFGVSALGPILFNVTLLTAALTLSGTMETPVFALVVGVLAGGALQFAVQLPALWKVGVRPADLLRFRDAAVGRVMRLMSVVVFGAAVYQVNVLLATILASLLPEGSVSYLWYADRVFEFPLGVVAVAVGTAALPSLSSQAKSGEFAAMAETVNHSLRLTWVLCLPAMAGLWVLAEPITELLFERGRFDAHDSAMTAWALRWYVPGLFAVGSMRVLVAPFYALERPRVPVRIAAVALVVNIAVGIALMGPVDVPETWPAAGAFEALARSIAIVDLRHAGLALATGVSAAFNALALAVALTRLLPPVGWGGLAVCAARHCVACAVLVVAVLAVSSRLGGAGAAVELAVAIPAGAVAYVIAAWLLGSEELGELRSALLRRLSRA